MVFWEVIVHSLFFAVLFYIFIAILVIFHGFRVPALAFSDLGALTAFIYMFLMAANYRL